MPRPAWDSAILPQEREARGKELWRMDRARLKAGLLPGWLTRNPTLAFILDVYFHHSACARLRGSAMDVWGRRSDNSVAALAQIESDPESAGSGMWSEGRQF